MKVPNHLRALAAEAFAARICWTEFAARYDAEIAAAEPFSRGRQKRLRELLRSVVCSGSTAGLFAIGDPDAAAEAFGDEPMTQSTFVDTSEPYR